MRVRIGGGAVRSSTRLGEQAPRELEDALHADRVRLGRRQQPYRPAAQDQRPERPVEQDLPARTFSDGPPILLAPDGYAHEHREIELPRGEFRDGVGLADSGDDVDPDIGTGDHQRFEQAHPVGKVDRVDRRADRDPGLLVSVQVANQALEPLVRFDQIALELLYLRRLCRLGDAEPRRGPTEREFARDADRCPEPPLVEIHAYSPFPWSFPQSRHIYKLVPSITPDLQLDFPAARGHPFAGTSPKCRAVDAAKRHHHPAHGDRRSARQELPR